MAKKKISFAQYEELKQKYRYNPSAKNVLGRSYKKSEKAKAEKQVGKELGITKQYQYKLGGRVFKKAEGRKRIARTARGVSNILKAFGVVKGQASRSGAGRPKATYKYNMPIQQYKKLMTQRRAQFQQYNQEQSMKMQGIGYTPEQTQQLKYLRELQARGIPVQVPTIQGPIDTPQSVMASADEDLEFRKFRADKTISPNTQRILKRLRTTQLKSQRDDVEMQRRLKERRMVGKAGSLLATPYVFNRYQLNLTGVSEDNILMAPNTFKEDPINNPHILKPRQVSVLTPIDEFNIMKKKTNSINIF